MISGQQFYFKNNYNYKMKPRSKALKQQQYFFDHSQDTNDFSYFSKPLKSPSPDKKSANIIVSTKSPDVEMIRRNSTPTKEETSNLRNSQKSQLRQKHFQYISTPNSRREMAASYKNMETNVSNRRQDKNVMVGQYQNNSPSNSKSRNIKIEISGQNRSEDMEIKHASSRYRNEFKGQLSELDYIRILKSKQEIIHQLKEVIEQIQNASKKSQHQINAYENKFTSLLDENKELKIENQYLLSAVEKSRGSLHSNKEEILQREIRELRESIRAKQSEFEDLRATFSHTIQKDKQQLRNLQNQNHSLIRLLKQKKQKDDNDKSRQDSLGSSSLSIQQSNSKNGDIGNRLSLQKIKEMHQQNIKILQQNFYKEIKNAQQSFFAQIDHLNQTVQYLNNRLQKLQNLKSMIDVRSSKKKPNADEQMFKEKIRHQEIQTVLLQKYNYYEKQLIDQKNLNQQLQRQLAIAHETINKSKQNQENQYEDNNNEEMRLQITRLRKQNYNLSHQNENLQEQKRTLRQQGQRNIEDLKRQLEDKLIVIIQEYESKLKDKNSQYQTRLSQFGEKLRQKQHEQTSLIESHEREKVEIEQKLKDALKIYDKQIISLKQSLQQKSMDIIFLNQQLEKHINELASIKQRKHDNSSQVQQLKQQCDQLKNKCILLTKNNEALTQELDEANNNFAYQSHEKQLAQSDNKRLNLENIGLKEEISKLNDHYDHILRSQIQKADREKAQLTQQLNTIRSHIDQTAKAHKQVTQSTIRQIKEKDEHNSLLRTKIYDYEVQIESKLKENQKLKGLLSSVNSQKSSLRYETIEQQLNQLKRLVSQYYSKSNSKLDNEIREQYHRLCHSHEIKIQQNVKMMKEIEDLRAHISNEAREKLLLSEKIALLQSNIVIYERQLRERKQLYEQVFQDKIRIEKQVLLSKKIKAEQSNISESYKYSASEITSRIDRLVEFERQRCKKIKQFTQEVYKSSV